MCSSSSTLNPRQFGFREQCCTSHAVLIMVEQIRQYLDNGGLACGVFGDLQKAFSTVDKEILLSNLNHYGLCGISNN